MSLYVETEKIKKALLCLFVMIFFAGALSVESRAEVVVSPEGITFDTEYYALQNPEIAEEYGNTYDGLYRHYLEHGKFEGRYPNAEEAAQNHADSTSSNRVNNNPDANIIIIGDSRVYLMHQTVGDDVANWFGFSGTGIRALIDKISPRIDNLALAGKKIIIMYGINDLFPYGSPENLFGAYNDFFSSKAQQWVQKGAAVYYVDLAGVGYGADPNGVERPIENINAINAQVAQYNKLIMAFPGNIGHVQINWGVNSFYDGIHFKPEVSREIYQQILKQVK